MLPHGTHADVQVSCMVRRIPTAMHIEVKSRTALPYNIHGPVNRVRDMLEPLVRLDLLGREEVRVAVGRVEEARVVAQQVALAALLHQGPRQLRPVLLPAAPGEARAAQALRHALRDDRRVLLLAVGRHAVADEHNVVRRGDEHRRRGVPHVAGLAGVLAGPRSEHQGDLIREERHAGVGQAGVQPVPRGAGGQRHLRGGHELLVEQLRAAGPCQEQAAVQRGARRVPARPEPLLAVLEDLLQGQELDGPEAQQP
mmetsp:Transcript_8290/g.25567  ORF Transcript_8290/g.25567 Transcript_8290/m.25567 type:complete len:255 (-) Transcript_8290:546-1310(-)